MLRQNSFFRYLHPASGRGLRSGSRVMLVAVTVLVWAGVAYSAVGWLLRDNSWAVQTDINSAKALTDAEIDTVAVARTLGVPQQIASVPTLSVDSRLQLLGVLNGDGNVGVALIAIDGKLAKPYRVGKTVVDGLVVQSTSSKRVQLGASMDGPSTLSLDLPVKK